MRDIQTYGNYFKSIINLHSTEASMFLMCCSGITRNKQKIVFKSHLDSGTGTIFSLGGQEGRRWRDRRSRARRGGTKRRSAEGGGVWGGAL